MLPLIDIGCGIFTTHVMVTLEIFSWAKYFSKHPPTTYAVEERKKFSVLFIKKSHSTNAIPCQKKMFVESWEFFSFAFNLHFPSWVMRFWPHRNGNFLLSAKSMFDRYGEEMELILVKELLLFENLSVWRKRNQSI